VDALIAGGPEDLLTLAEQEVLPPTPTVLGPDRSAEAEPERILLTDGLRRRERNFGRVHDATSGVLTAGSESDRDVPARDYLLPGQEEWETVARWDGAREVSASSSLADVGSVGEARPELAPYSALDGDLSTQWVSGSEPRAAWLQVDLETPRNLSSVELVGSGVLGDDRQLVRVRTEQGVGEAVGLSPGEPALAQFPPGPTDWIRVEGAAGIAGQRLAVAEIDVPGVTVSRPLVTPVLPESWDAPDLISLDATAGWRSGCAPIRFDVRCVPDETRKGEEPLGLDRVVTMPRAGRYAARLQVRPRPGAELDEILQRDRLVRVRATSTATDEPSGSVSAAVDGLRGTTWIAAGDDDDPALTVSWVEPQRVDRLRLVLDRQAAATPAEEVTVTYDGGEQTAEVDEHGFVRLDPLRTRSMEIALSPGEPARGLGSDGRLSEYGVGVSELRIPEATGLPMIMPATPERRPCGSGPDLLVDGVTLPTRVNASRRDLILGDPVEATLCGAGRSVALVPGENRLTFGSDRGFTGVTVLLGEPAELAEAAAPSPAAPTAERLERDQVTPAVSDLKGEGLGRPGAAALGDNWNAGWAARDQGEPVDPLVVDGWRQGWQLPVQGEELTVEFAPDRWYRLGLLVGGAVAAVLTALVLVGVLRRRRTSLAPEGAEHPRTPIALLGSGVLAAGLLAGWPGLLMAVVLVLGVAVWSGLWARHRSWLVAAPVAAAALVVWWRPWGAAEGWAGELALPQLLVLCSVLMLAVGDSSRWLGRLRQGGLRSRSRMKGSSTAR
jgi:arabinofuranan 3-O-arabinosyltransferase